MSSSPSIKKRKPESTETAVTPTKPDKHPLYKLALNVCTQVSLLGPEETIMYFLFKNKEYHTFYVDKDELTETVTGLIDNEESFELIHGSKIHLCDSKFHEQIQDDLENYIEENTEEKL